MDPVGISIDELAAAASANPPPELGENFDFFTRILELVEEVGGIVFSPLLVKGDRLKPKSCLTPYLKFNNRDRPRETTHHQKKLVT
jgi:hypothetical protein